MAFYEWRFGISLLAAQDSMAVQPETAPKPARTAPAAWRGGWSAVAGSGRRWHRKPAASRLWPIRFRT